MKLDDENFDLKELFAGADKRKVRELLDGMDGFSPVERFVLYGHLGLFDGYADLVRTVGDCPQLDLSIGNVPANKVADFIEPRHRRRFGRSRLNPLDKPAWT